MKREIAVDGKPYRVEVNNSNLSGPLSVKVNDKPVEVTLEGKPNNKEPFIIRVKEKTYSVELPKISGQTSFTVKVNNVPFKVELKTTARQSLVIPTTPTSVLIQRPTKKVVDEGVVTAPMAGKIIRVKVKKGDQVKAGDVLCTLEAMKMENEVTSPKNGVIQEVMAQEGKTVNADDVLVVIK